MAESDLDTLRQDMPEVFRSREVPDDLDNGSIFIGLDSPDKPYGIGDAVMATDGILDDGASMDESFFDPDLDVDVDVSRVLQPLVGTFGGPFAGGPSMPPQSAARPPTDCLAFYLPYHHFHPTWWGVYLIVDGVWTVAKYIWDHSGGAAGPLSPRDCWVAGRLYLFYHEIYHHNVESFATRLEVAYRQPLYVRGFQKYYAAYVGTSSCIEESLAEANAFRKVTHRRIFTGMKQTAVKRALLDFIRAGPPGYAEGVNFVRPEDFAAGQNDLAEGNLAACIPGLPAKPPRVWDSAGYMMRGFNDKAKGRAKYVVSAGSPLAKRIPFRPRLKPSELKRKLKTFGCDFVRDGGNHEVWVAPNGHRFPIPRHPGDLGTGLIRSILRQAGIQMGLDQFSAS